MPTTLRNTDILFNDGTTQSSALSTTSVLNATAGASVGAVGTYAYLAPASAQTNINPGATVAGSSLRYAGSDAGFLSSAPAGTWRCMGFVTWQCSCGFQVFQRGSVFLRIS